MEIRDSRGNVSLRILGDKIYDNEGRWVYTKNDNYICNASGYWVYEIRDDKIYDTQGRWVFQIHNETPPVAVMPPAMRTVSTLPSTNAGAHYNTVVPRKPGVVYTPKTTNRLRLTVLVASIAAVVLLIGVGTLYLRGREGGPGHAASGTDSDIEGSHNATQGYTWQEAATGNEDEAMSAPVPATLHPSGRYPTDDILAFSFAGEGIENIVFYNVPDIIFTTTGAENELGGTFMHITGIIYSFEEADEYELAIIQTDNGMIGLIIPWEFVFIFERILSNPNVFDSLEVGKEFGFFFMYQGFSGLFDMPAGMLVCVEPALIPEQTPEPKIATIEERELFDEAGIKVIVRSQEFDSRGRTELNVLVENHSNDSVTVQVRDVSVNGIMFTSTVFSSSVTAGHRRNDSISFQSSGFERLGIEEIGVIELSFRVINNSDRNLSFNTEKFTIETSIADQVSQPLPVTREFLFERDGISISLIGIEEGRNDVNVVFFIVNDTARDITIQARDENVNGFMISGIKSTNIQPGRMAIDTLSFSNRRLGENGINYINDIESIEFDLRIIDNDNRNATFDTGAIRINTPASASHEPVLPPVSQPLQPSRVVVELSLDDDYEGDIVSAVLRLGLDIVAGEYVVTIDGLPAFEGFEDFFNMVFFTIIDENVEARYQILLYDSRTITLEENDNGIGITSNVRGRTITVTLEPVN